MNNEAGAAVRVLRRSQPDEAEQDFEVFFRRNYPRLVRFLTRRCGNPDLAEDLAQEALAKAISTSDRWDWSRPMWPLLRSMGTNLLIDHVRRNQKEVISEELPEPAAPPERDYLIVESLKGIPQRQRVALALRYIEDWRAAEAASYLGLTIPAFDQLAYRARSSLKREYERALHASQGLVVLPFRRLRSALERAGAWARTPDLAVRATEAAMQAVAGAICVVTATTQVVPAAPAIRLAVPQERYSSQSPIEEERRAGAPDRPTRDASRLPEKDPAAIPPTEPPAEPDTTADRIVDDFSDPQRGVEDPEDAQLSSMAASPNYKRDRTLYAAGTTYCRLPTCPSVLFVSRDGGATWERLPARGFQGLQLILPRSAHSDYPIFAMGPAGLQKSIDGGRTFVTAALGGVPFTVGSAAISPEFDSGDPTILIGAQMMMQYDGQTGAIMPAPYTAIPGPMEPAFTPHNIGSSLYVGALKTSGSEFSPVVYRCDTTVCWERVLRNGGKHIPKIRFHEHYVANQRVFAFTENGVYLSPGYGLPFDRIMFPGEGLITDVQSLAGHLFVSTTNPSGRKAAIYRRTRSGHWIRLDHRLLTGGVHGLTALGAETIVALLDSNGLACSHDAGETWSRRC